jgi:membrane-bound lytic murein transglycosylase F
MRPIQRRFGVFVAAAGISFGIGIPAEAQSTVTERFDGHFKKYSKRFFGAAFDWRLFKAQGMAESNLEPNARSWAGARGLMQLMPSTHREVRSRNPDLHVIRGTIEMNIAAGIAYNRQLWQLWTNDSEHDHLREFMFASYNAGRATLLRAQRLAQEGLLNHRVWPSITVVAPKVPRWRYEETLTYVERIFANLSQMDHGGRVRP